MPSPRSGAVGWSALASAALCGDGPCDGSRTQSEAAPRAWRSASSLDEFGNSVTSGARPGTAPPGRLDVLDLVHGLAQARELQYICFRARLEFPSGLCSGRLCHGL